MHSIIQRKHRIEAPGSSAPPIPLRNPLRDIPRYQATQRHHPASNENIETSKSSFAAQKPFEEVHREPRDAQQSPASDRSIFERPDAKMERRTCRIDDARPLRDQDKISPESTSNSLTNGLKRYSAFLGKGNPSTVHQDDERSRKQGEIVHAIARMRSSLDMSDAFTSTSSYDGAPTDWPIVEVEEDDARIEAWLQRGVVDTAQPQFDRVSQSDKAPDSTPAKRHPDLTTFPPTSPVTGRREYSSPLSPMNNGRDAYGNYIATNARDYVTTQPSPSLSTTRSIVQDTPRQKLKQSSRPNLRGGGGWWNPLGIGKESLVTEPSSGAELRGTHRSISVPSLKSKYTMGNQDHSSSNLGGYREDSQAGSTFGMNYPPTKGRALVEFENDWSDESDPEIVNKNEHRRLGHTQPTTNNQCGSLQNRLRNHSKIPTPLSPGHTFVQNYNTHDQNISPSLDDEKSTHFGATIRTVNELDSDPKRPCIARQRAESPQSDATHSPRTHKRWNRVPATGPPIDPAMPPPIPPKYGKPGSEVASSLGTVSLFMAQYERPDSPVESYDDHAWELRSLQLGESVSVAGHGPRHYPKEMPARQQPTNLSPEGFEARQLRAQVGFRPLCQDVMIRYNAETSRIDRALERDQMSPEQYQAQMKWNTDNKNKALTYSAEKTGYVILEDESSILKAMETTDGYAIYQDMLKPTKPGLWQKLDEQHRRQSATEKPRDSSLDQARQVAGKIARFVLAAPSDPDLKTYSTRRPSNAQNPAVHTSISLSRMDWMDPMSAAASTSITNNDAWRTQRKKDKVVQQHAVPTNQASPSRLTGTTAAPGIPPWWTAANVNERPDAPVRSNSRGTTTASEESMWPEGDSLGNGRDVRRPVEPQLRGGAGTEKKKKKSKPWRNVLYGETMHFHV